MDSAPKRTSRWRHAAGGQTPPDATAATSSVIFADYTWTVKASGSKVGPGPNLFSAANVTVDRHGLHLRIVRTRARWTCAEVIAQGRFGYGTYRWTVASDVTRLDPNAVLGMFTWSDRPDFAHREIDIEFAKWGIAHATQTGLFTVHGAATPSSPAFALAESQRSIHTLTWSPGEVCASSTTPGEAPFTWSHGGAGVPEPGGDVAPRVNLWLFRGSSPARPLHMTIESFSYVPAG